MCTLVIFSIYFVHALELPLTEQRNSAKIMERFSKVRRLQRLTITSPFLNLGCFVFTSRSLRLCTMSSPVLMVVKAVPKMTIQGLIWRNSWGGTILWEGLAFRLSRDLTLMKKPRIFSRQLMPTMAASFSTENGPHILVLKRSNLKRMLVRS